MSLNQHKLQILGILSENLQSSRPQLVPTTEIAGKIDIQLPKLHQILNAMNSIGVIQTDTDLQYSLITRKGLKYLNER